METVNILKLQFCCIFGCLIWKPIQANVMGKKFETFQNNKNTFSKKSVSQNNNLVSENKIIIIILRKFFNILRYQVTFEILTY